MTEFCSECMQSGGIVDPDILRDEMSDILYDDSYPAETSREYVGGAQSMSGWVSYVDSEAGLRSDTYRIPHRLCPHCAERAVGMTAVADLPDGPPIVWEIAMADDTHATVAWDYA